MGSGSLQAAVAGLALVGMLLESRTAPDPEQRLAQAAALRDSALASNQLMLLLTDLATRVGPRPAGSPGDARVREWLLERLGPLGFDSVWTDSLPVPRWERGIASAELLADTTRSLSVLAFGFSASTPAGGLEARLVSFPTSSSVLAAQQTRLRDRIVFVDQRMTRAQDGRGYAAVGRDRGAAVAHAARAGAVAVLVRSPGTELTTNPHLANINYPPGTPRIPVGSIANRDADLLAGELLADTAARMRLRLDSRDLPQGWSSNVVAELRGGERTDEVVLLGAHLDSWDVGSGTLDDGAGMVLLLETGRLLRLSGQRPDRTLRLVFFAAEEIGLRGARRYAETELRRVRHVLALEPDQGGGRAYRIRGRLDEPGTRLLNDAAAVLNSLGIDYLPDPSISGPDLIPLREAGVPTIDIAQDMTQFWDAAHSADDTIERVVPDDLATTLAAYVAFTFLALHSQ